MRRRTGIVVGLAMCATLTASSIAVAQDARAELLERDAAHARLWWWSFTAVYAAAGIVQTVMSFTVDDAGLRVDSAVGAASTWLGVAGMFISPIPAVWQAADRARETGRYDLALARAAEAEADARAWYNHAACVVVALGAGAVLWFGYDRPESAAINAAGNLLVGELNLLTQPRRALSYREHGTARWQLMPGLGGAQLAVRW